MRKKIVLLSQFKERVHELLDDVYEIVTVSSTDEALAVLAEQYNDIIAVLADVPYCSAHDHAFLDAIKDEVKYSFIAIVALVEGRPTAEDAELLEHGVGDFASVDIAAEVIKNRIQNVIRLKDSKTYVELESILKELPSLIFLKDSEGKYVFSTHYWHHLDQGDDPNWTIRGKTDVEIRKDKENAIGAMEADKLILETGEGARYTIKIDLDDKLEFLDITKQPIRNANGDVSGIVALINDVTEQELLRMELQRASTIDGLTGLFNRITIQRHVEESLHNMSGHDFSLIMIDIDNFKIINDTFGHQRGDEVICELSRIISETPYIYTDEHYEGRWGGEEFMIVLPKEGESTAYTIAEEIRKAFAETVFEGLPPQTLSLGVTQARTTDSLDSLYTRVDDALYEAKGNGGDQICVY